jgi:hypothetical protein
MKEYTVSRTVYPKTLDAQMPVENVVPVSLWDMGQAKSLLLSMMSADDVVEASYVIREKETNKVVYVATAKSMA